MKKKYINTLAAALILVTLWGAFIIYDKRKTHADVTKITATTETQQKIFSIDTQHIQSFTLEPKDSPPITFARQSGNWKITAPQKLAADQPAVASLLSTLTTATVDQVVDAHPSSLKDFGLDPPSETIEVSTDAKPAQFSLKLGDSTPTSSGVYAQAGGNSRVVMLASFDKTDLTKTLFDLRDKRALTLDADQIQKIEVKSKDKNYTLEKNPEGVWDLVLPPPVRADHTSVDSMVSTLRGLSMVSIVSEDKIKSGQYGFGAATLTVKLTTPSASQTLVLGKKDGTNYDAMNSALDPIFTLGSDALTQLQKDPADLRDKDLFSYSTFDVSQFTLKTPKGRWAFEKQKDKWRETAPKSKELATDKVESLLDDIRDLRADSFPKGPATDLAAYGLDKPAYYFEVQSGSKKEMAEAAKLGENVYARRSEDAVPSELAKTALDPIEKSLAEM